VIAWQADLDRRDVLARVVHALVDAQLRPGADASRVDAERAAALTRLIQARQTLALAQTAMARLLGVRGAVPIDPSALLNAVPPSVPEPAPAPLHPLAQAHQASVDAARAQERVLARTDLPRVYLQSSVFARGSGADPSGALDGGASGLGLERANWAAGVQVQLPNLFDFASLRARKAAAAAAARAEAALYDDALLSIASEQDAAAALVRSAREVAANTPVQLAAARQSETQARARYDAGLAPLVEVADAQSLLAQADVQDQLARIDVWRALVAEGVATGTLTPLLTQLGSAGAR
jgi:outer membrane protein TolC